jgi:hypothetical protein
MEARRAASSAERGEEAGASCRKEQTGDGMAAPPGTTLHPSYFLLETESETTKSYETFHPNGFFLFFSKYTSTSSMRDMSTPRQQKRRVTKERGAMVVAEAAPAWWGEVNTILCRARQRLLVLHPGIYRTRDQRAATALPVSFSLYL